MSDNYLPGDVARISVRVADITGIAADPGSVTLKVRPPLGAVAAFKRAFGDDPGARLILKTVNVDSDPAGARALIEAIDGATNIEIVDAVL